MYSSDYNYHPPQTDFIEPLIPDAYEYNELPFSYSNPSTLTQPDTSYARFQYKDDVTDYEGGQSIPPAQEYAFYPFNATSEGHGFSSHLSNDYLNPGGTPSTSYTSLNSRDTYSPTSSSYSLATPTASVYPPQFQETQPQSRFVTTNHHGHVQGQYPPFYKQPQSLPYHVDANTPEFEHNFNGYLDPFPVVPSFQSQLASTPFEASHHYHTVTQEFPPSRTSIGVISNPLDEAPVFHSTFPSGSNPASLLFSSESDTLNPQLVSGIPSHLDTPLSSATNPPQPPLSQPNLFDSVNTFSSTFDSSISKSKSKSIDDDKTLKLRRHVGSDRHTLATMKRRKREGTVPCPYDWCPKTFTAQNSMSRHKDAHNKRRYPCLTCEKMFSTNSNAKRHVDKGKCRGRRKALV